MRIDFDSCAIGIEFGSTRIKAVLTSSEGKVLASGSFEWQNRYENGYWTYPIELVTIGLKSAYKALKDDVKAKYGLTIKRVGAIGVSAMMHGYLVFGKDGRLLTPFRTWRNDTASRAADELTEIFGFHIPARWSIAHLYQAILDKEEHVKDIDYLVALEGYVHRLLTGKRVIGLNEASGMFPLDSLTKDYDAEKTAIFDKILEDRGYRFKLKDIMPRPLCAGENAGYLTEEGAILIDEDGDLEPGIPFCPPEGDGGTGMVATNSVRAGKGNLSAGTSVFAVIVLKDQLKKLHREVDMFCTPTGVPAANVHCGNCSSDLNAWVRVFEDFAGRLGAKIGKNELYELLFRASTEGKSDCDGLLSYNFLSGEHLFGITEGRPIVTREINSEMNLPNFTRSLLYSTFAGLAIGIRALTMDEGVGIDSLVAHGGLFKTEGVLQRYVADAFGVPVTVMETAGEGGAWGMSLLALYSISGGKRSFEDYLDGIFANTKSTTIAPSKANSEGFAKYLDRYERGLAVERKAVELL